jgi:integrase
VAWVTTPAGRRRRKYLYGKTRDDVHDKWIKLLNDARRGPIATRIPKLGDYLTYWLAEIIEPNRAPYTYATYETLARLYIVPRLGEKRLDRLSVRDVQSWVNALRRSCQCCAQGKDERRAEDDRRCCAIGNCCESYPADRTIAGARAVLRSALSHAATEELISRNVAMLVKLPTRRKRRGQAWTSDEARAFLESARNASDALYAAYVLVLVLGLRKGEVLGLVWDDVDLEAGELQVIHQLQRVRGQLLHRVAGRRVGHDHALRESG